jgi:sigma-E factor negative regulatory protein RseC
MIQEQGVVTAVTGDLIEVRVQQQSACGSCSAKSGCGTSIVASLFPGRHQRLQLPNSINAVVGDRVILSIAEQAVVSGSLRLYLFPLLGLIAGAMLLNSVAAQLSLPQELFQVIGGLFGMGLVLFIVSRMRRQEALGEIQLHRSPDSVSGNRVSLNNLTR